jgi:hypothetical protein
VVVVVKWLWRSSGYGGKVVVAVAVLGAVVLMRVVAVAVAVVVTTAAVMAVMTAVTT